MKTNYKIPPQKNTEKTLKTHFGIPLSVHIEKYVENILYKIYDKNIIRPINLYAKVHNTIEKLLLHKIMILTNQNQSKASRILGISRTTLRMRLKKYNYLYG